MRIYLKLTRNTSLLPYNYQHLLTGVIHKWIGNNNDEHGKSSLYSFSWFQNTQATKDGINLTNDAYFFISAFESNLMKKIIRGILNDPDLFMGIKVVDVQIKDTPSFGNEERFFLNSPILIKKTDGDKTKHITYLDREFNELLTKNLQTKLSATGLSAENVVAEWDKNYLEPKTKLVDYKGVRNKTTLAPIIIKGTPEQLAFVWTVGLGNSTGIGFGAVK